MKQVFLILGLSLGLTLTAMFSELSAQEASAPQGLSAPETKIPSKSLSLSEQKAKTLYILHIPGISYSGGEDTWAWEFNALPLLVQVPLGDKWALRINSFLLRRESNWEDGYEGEERGEDRFLEAGLVLSMPWYWSKQGRDEFSGFYLAPGTMQKYNFDFKQRYWSALAGLGYGWAWKNGVVLNLSNWIRYPLWEEEYLVYNLLFPRLLIGIKL